MLDGREPSERPSTSNTPKPAGVTGHRAVKQFYVAVSSASSKLATLIELLTALQAEQKMALAICCGSRDALDAVVAALMETRKFAVCALHSDMTDGERAFIIGNFSRLTSRQAEDETDVTDPSLVLVATDVSLRSISRDLLPLNLPLLIQYDLPAKKDILPRRLSSIFGTGRDRRRSMQNVVIYFVVAGEVPSFRAVERFGPGVVCEMPVYVADILK